MRPIEHARFLADTGRGIVRWTRDLGTYAPGELRPRLWAVAAAVALRALRLPVPVPPLRLAIRGRRFAAHVRSHVELAAAHEVLCTPDYFVEARGVRRVVDLGANIGLATLLFAALWPDAQILSVEPAPDTFERLQATVAGLPNVRVRQVAVGAPGTIRLDTSAPSTERHPSAAGVPVPRIALSQLLADAGWDAVDVLKVDVEGDEFDVLPQAAAIPGVALVVGELHRPAAPPGFSTLDDLLPGFTVTRRPGPEPYPMFEARRR
jgi:FkbM family methyltransferase